MPMWLSSRLSLFASLMVDVRHLFPKGVAARKGDLQAIASTCFEFDLLNPCDGLLRSCNLDRARRIAGRKLFTYT